MKRSTTKIVRKLLNFEQKQCRMDIAQESLTTVITGDESWVYGYDIETKAQSLRFATIEEINEKPK